MSGTLASPGGAGETPPNPAVRAGKSGCGCLGSLGGVMALAIGLLLLLNPWALHMGGRWTPALIWHGVGKLHASSGATYGLYLELYPDFPQPRRRGGFGVRKNLRGTAKICTPDGEIYALTVDGYLAGAWLDADRKPITFYLRSLADSKPKLRADFYGDWQGQELVVDDQGSMAMSFAADGKAKGYLQGANAPAEDTTGSLRYARESEFAAVCGGKAKSSF